MICNVMYALIRSFRRVKWQHKCWTEGRKNICRCSMPCEITIAGFRTFTARRYASFATTAA